MLPGCPRNGCGNRSPRPKSVLRGRFFRKSDGHWVSRFACRGCGRSFSTATDHPCFGQNRRDINEPLRKLLASNISMRRAAWFLGVHRVTVARKLRFLGLQSRIQLDRFRAAQSRLPAIQFDELETFEHTKYKPLSVVLAVTEGERKILGFRVASMPASGRLAARARRRYGPRPDGRSAALDELFRDLAPHLAPNARVGSDANPRYPPIVRRYLPGATHWTTKGGRGCVVGYGELKALRHDPLFSLNHTFAMCRANLSRLIRRTWCTTKRPDRLADHLAIYAELHNRCFT